MNKRGQSVFYGAIFLIVNLLLFVLLLSPVMGFIANSKANEPSILAKLFSDLIPFLWLVIIIWGGVKIMRAE
jgi:ABC-type polysaccharide/polyol phosphate export permease